MRRTQELVWFPFLILGCAAEGVAPPALAPTSLREPVRVESHTPQASSNMTVQVATRRANVEVSFTPGALDLALRTGDQPRLETLTLPLGDVDVGPELLPPDGLKLRDVSVGISEAVPLEVVHASASLLELHARMPLRLEWSLLLPDGTRYALGPAVTEPVSVDVEVQRSSDGAGAITRLHARCEGACWAVEGLARLNEGQLHLVADSTLSPIR